MKDNERRSDVSSRPQIARACLAAVVVGSLAVLSGGCREAADVSSGPSAVASPTAPAQPTTSAPTASPPKPPTTPASPPGKPTTSKPPTSKPPTAPADGALRSGANGPAVLALQQRLKSLGFWLGQPDGSYGSATSHAVTAFQKSAGLARDGAAGPATLRAIERADRLRPRSTSGRVIEVDLRRQILLVVAGGQVQWVIDASTGKVAGTTPTGHFSVSWQVDGYRQAPLGVLYRPKYFAADGVAVHGYPSVPSTPASHGCVRVTNAAMDWLWSQNLMPIGTAVWVY